MNIKTKNEFMRLWRAGKLGNKPRTWDTVTEALKSDYKGFFALRYNGIQWGGPLITTLRRADLQPALNHLTQQGYLSTDFYVYEDIPTDGIVINGEVGEVGQGWQLCLTYSTVPLRMRESFIAGGHIAYGIEAKRILTDKLWPGDLEQLYEILEEYPGHVVEFTGYCRNVGILNRPMIIWEVRNY